MNLIAIETATDVCGVALLQGGEVTVEVSLNRPRAHAENLVLLIQDALRYGGVDAADVDAIAVSMGPGSYTGLRIGVSAAKGLAVALDAALVGVPTLEALAASVVPYAEAGDIVCAALHARRDEVYAAAFRIDGQRALDPLAPAAALTAEEVSDWLALPSPTAIRIAGDGGPKVAAALREGGIGDVHLLDPVAHRPSAAWVARRALLKVEREEVEDAASFEPFYLKEFVAKKRARSAFERLPF